MYKRQEANTGALGHGLSIASGMAMAAKLERRRYKVYAICGDGELPEGSNWEAAAAAAKFGLDNLVVDVYKRQESMRSKGVLSENCSRRTLLIWQHIKLTSPTESLLKLVPLGKILLISL